MAYDSLGDERDLSVWKVPTCRSGKSATNPYVVRYHNGLFMRKNHFHFIKRGE